MYTHVQRSKKETRQILKEAGLKKIAERKSCAKDNPDGIFSIGFQILTPEPCFFDMLSIKMQANICRDGFDAPL